MIPDSKPPIPIELLRLRKATRAYLSLLKEVQRAKAAILAYDDKDEAGQLLLDFCEAAGIPTECGTPAAILMALEDLIGDEKKTDRNGQSVS